ncbi:MAG: endolytic transglycosylase MltG [Oscillospiraceae bacterium]|nr:endolytic transglycosylase MltG [Oscillospiraceae bacterium]
MARNNKRPPRDYDHETLRRERAYGFFWYDWLWRVLRPALVLLTSLCLVGGLLMAGWAVLNRRFVAPVDPADATPRAFVVKSGSSLTRVSSDLEAAGLVRSKTVFKYLADFVGVGQKLQPGEYSISRAMTMREIMDLFAAGDGRPTTKRITVIPGWTVEDIAERFAADGVIPDRDAFLRLCRTGETYRDYYYVADVLASPKANQRRYILEGYLSPNTYEIYADATADDIIKKLLSQTEAAFPATYFERAEELGLTMDQVLTLASLIEKEGKTADFARVSAVFHNRLTQNMALGSDVTIKYVLGTKKMVLNNQDLAVTSAYNTYANKGLPVGPICNPSGDAVLAALYPDEQFVAQKYLYFCSADPNTGALVFSRTQKEHDAAVAQYRPLWEAFDQGRGL